LNICAFALVAGLTFAPAAFAQTDGIDSAAFPIREDFAQVAPAQGPAWWKVSKGASVVWIMGAPPPRLKGELNWDKTSYRRRLKGARLVLLPYDDRSSFVEGGDWVAVLLRLDQDVQTALDRALRRREQANLTRYRTAFTRRLEYLRERDALTRTHTEILREAERSRAPLVRSPISEYTPPAVTAPSADPTVAACTEEARLFTISDPKAFERANQYWAAGDVPSFVQATPKASPQCRSLWRGARQANIAFQTQVVMEALRRPGKVVAVYPIDNLIAKDGILARLQAEGYTVADPSLPLSEE
jgi:hypothetical protein